MKTLNLILIIFLSFALVNNTIAQEAKVSVKSSTKRVVINEFGNDLIIKTHQGSEVIIETDTKIVLPERAKGLKPISATGATDNTGVGIEAKEMDNTLYLNNASPIARKADYRILVPKGMSLKIIANNFMANGDILVDGFDTEVEIGAKVRDVVLSDVTGPLVVNTLSGGIQVVFSKVNQSSPISIASTSGDIDVSMPADTKAELDFRTMSGGSYSDFELEFDSKDKKGMYKIGGSKIQAKVNGGGVEMSFSTMSGNIFLRKK